MIDDIRIIEILNEADVPQLDDVPISYDLQIARAILNSPELKELYNEKN